MKITINNTDDITKVKKTTDVEIDLGWGWCIAYWVVLIGIVVLIGKFW